MGSEYDDVPTYERGALILFSSLLYLRIPFKRKGFADAFQEFDLRLHQIFPRCQVIFYWLIFYWRNMIRLICLPVRPRPARCEKNRSSLHAVHRPDVTIFPEGSPASRI